MSDTVHTKIAAILKPRLLSLMRFPDSSIAAHNASVMADAVIRALDLREERTLTELVTDPYSGATWTREGGHRYVTDWIADE